MIVGYQKWSISHNNVRSFTIALQPDVYNSRNENPVLWIEALSFTSCKAESTCILVSIAIIRTAFRKSTRLVDCFKSQLVDMKP